ncbi:hypothetical protein J6590_107087, partial [Homalodisca vitripennis]
SSLIKDLSVDWVNRKIFWVDWNTQNIYQTDLKDNSREVVLFHPSKIHQLAIDPYYRKKGTAQDVSSSHDYYHTTLQHRRRWDTDKKINVGTSCGLAVCNLKQ